MARAKKRSVGRPSKGPDANIFPVHTKLSKGQLNILQERAEEEEGLTQSEIVRKDIQRGNREFRRKKVRKSKRG